MEKQQAEYRQGIKGARNTVDVMPAAVNGPRQFDPQKLIIRLESIHNNAVRVKNNILASVSNQEPLIANKFHEIITNITESLNEVIEDCRTLLTTPQNLEPINYCVIALPVIVSKIKSLLATTLNGIEMTNYVKKQYVLMQFNEIQASISQLIVEISPVEDVQSFYLAEDQALQKQQALLAAPLGMLPSEIQVEFEGILSQIKTLAMERNFLIPEVFISYARPTDTNQHEHWVQEFLQLYCRHLNLAGIVTYLDIINSRMGFPPAEHMARIRSCSHVILIGTLSLAEKELGKGHMVQTELNYIRESIKQGKPRAMPILLSGEYETAFPIDFLRYTAIEGFRDTGYLCNLQEVIKFLFVGEEINKAYDLLWHPFNQKYLQHFPAPYDPSMHKTKRSGGDSMKFGMGSHRFFMNSGVAQPIGLPPSYTLSSIVATTAPNLKSLTNKIRSLCQKQASDVSLQDDFGFFVPPLATYHQNSKDTRDLNKEVNDFLGSDKKVLLISGESGTGKSFYCQSLVKARSESYQEGDRIPLFISLPSLRKPKTHLIQEALGLHGFTPDEIETLRRTHRIILILDAYDECNIADNLIVTNNLTELLDVKIIVTCRTVSTVKNDNYKSRFYPYIMQNPAIGLFQELFLSPFNRGQIEQYIAQYLKINFGLLNEEIKARRDLSEEWLLSETYMTWIDEVPGLKDLASQPFLLRITMDVLPEIVIEFQALLQVEMHYEINHAKLYDIFVKKWFSRQENKLISTGKSPGERFQVHCMAFSKALAKKMYKNNVTVVYFEEKSFIEDVSEDEQNVAADMAQWALFFSDELVPEDQDSDERRQIRIRCRNACPLKKMGENQWGFIHASLRDHFFSLTISRANQRTALVISEDSQSEPPTKVRVTKGKF